MATYYFDAVNGNDNNPTNAIATPWKSLAKVTSTSLLPGDSVLFNRGGTWLPWDSGTGRTGGAFTIGESGSNGAAITFGAYGSGANPLISGFYTVPTTGWTRVGTSNVYTIRDTVHFPTTMLNVLLYNGTLAPLGRFPATGYLTYTGSTGTTQITFASGSLPTTYTTGEVVIRKANWALTRGTINTQTSTTITYTATGTNQLAGTAGYGFFVQNHQNTLAKTGDWCYNPSTQTLSMYFSSGPTGTIRISTTDTLVSFSAARSYNIFSGISFEGANSYGINGNTGSDHIQVNSCAFTNIGVHAVFFGDANTCTISNNVITGSVNNAILLSNAVNNTICSNTVNNTGLVAGMGQSTDGTNGVASYIGIAVNSFATAFGNIISQNTIFKTGYCGIHILGDTFLVDSNRVDTVCSVIDDGGCIYTDAGTAGARTYAGRMICNNECLNSIGAPAGTTGRNWGNGLMCDDNSSNLTLANNTVYNCAQYGIYFHNNHEVTCINNTSYNNAIAQIAIQQDTVAANLPAPINFTISNNTLTAGTSTQLLLRFRFFLTASVASDFRKFGVCDNNGYHTPFTNLNLFSTQITGASETFRQFADWKSYTLKDVSSTFGS